MLLTEDLIQWLLADHKVCQGWKGLAERLELAHLIPAISEDPQKCKLKLLFAAWKEARHDSYNVETLKTSTNTSSGSQDSSVVTSPD